MNKNNKNMKTILMSWGGALLISSAVAGGTVWVQKDKGIVTNAKIDEIHAELIGLESRTPKIAILDGNHIMQKHFKQYITKNKGKKGFGQKQIDAEMSRLLHSLLDYKGALMKRGYFFLSPKAHHSWDGNGVHNFTDGFDDYLSNHKKNPVNPKLKTNNSNPKRSL